MHFSYARTDNIGSTPLDLSGAFGISTKNGIHIHDLNKNLAETIGSEAGEYETLEMSPWQIGLKERLTNLIANGLHGQAIDLLEHHISQYSEMHKDDVLNTLERALDSLENNGFDYQAQAFVSLLTDSQLGMHIEFHNTGPNSTGSTNDTGEIIRLKHRIEAHYDAHRHMTPQYVPQYLGVSVGPR